MSPPIFLTSLRLWQVVIRQVTNAGSTYSSRVIQIILNLSRHTRAYRLHHIQSSLTSSISRTRKHKNYWKDAKAPGHRCIVDARNLLSGYASDG